MGEDSGVVEGEKEAVKEERKGRGRKMRKIEMENGGGRILG